MSKISEWFDRWFKIDFGIGTKDAPLEESVMAHQIKPIDPTIRVRRVRIYRDAAGEFRFRAQGGNWRTIPGSEEGVKTKRNCTIRALRVYPQTEELVDDVDGKSYMFDDLAELKGRLLG